MIIRQIILVLAVTGTIIPLMSQPYHTGHKEMYLTDPNRANRVVDFHIYYPADNEGDGVPITSVNNYAFPLLVFGHGFVMEWSAYQNIWSALVPEGYILVMPITEGGLSPSHETFGKDLAFLIRAVTEFSNNSSSPFYKRIDTMNCVMGHSMGGGAAVLAAAMESSVKFHVTFAPAETNPSAISAASQITIPALIFASENDCVTPPASHQLPIYNDMSSLCKTYISIKGGSHCQMAESNLYCNIGEASCTPQPTITRAKQHEILTRYLIPWLDFHIKGDYNSGVQFDNSLVADPEVSFAKTCDLVGIETRFPDQSSAINIFPNPFSERINILLDNNPVFNHDLRHTGIFRMYDPAGMRVYEIYINNSGIIYPGYLKNGLYFWNFVTKNGETYFGSIVRMLNN